MCKCSLSEPLFSQSVCILSGLRDRFQRAVQEHCNDPYVCGYPSYPGPGELGVSAGGHTGWPAQSHTGLPGVQSNSDFRYSNALAMNSYLVMKIRHIGLGVCDASDQECTGMKSAWPKSNIIKHLAESRYCFFAFVLWCVYWEF